MKKLLFFTMVIAALLAVSVFAVDDADMLIQNNPEFVQGDVMLISDLEEPVSQLKYAPDGTPLFGDVDYEKDSFAGAVSILAKAKIVEGFPDGTFRPQNGLTRAEFCKMVNLIFGYKDLDKTGFPDVVKEDIHCWFYDVALIAKKAGYIKGYENGDFRGNNNLTREETCTILNRLLKLYAIPLPGMEITDKVSDWAVNDVNAVVTNMMMPLEEGNTFRATEIIKRSEVVVVLANLYAARQEEKKENEGSSNTGSGNTGSGNTGSGNTGSGNTGSGNTGSSNAGSGNTGSENTGSGNTGSGNTGSGNTGSGNTGSDNTGSGNTGSDNTGDNNTGDDNTGDDNTGSGNTGSGNTSDDNTGDDNTGDDNTGSDNTGDDNTGGDNTGGDNTGDDNEEMTPEEIEQANEEVLFYIKKARDGISPLLFGRSETAIKKLLIQGFDGVTADAANGILITPEYVREEYDAIIVDAVDKYNALSETKQSSFRDNLMNAVDSETLAFLVDYFPLEYFI